MVNIAFATCQKSPDITPDDQHVAQQLMDQGITVTAAVWNDPHIDWAQYDAVIIRSTWDYHLHANDYAQWLRKCQQQHVNLYNSPQQVLSNLNKHYLRDLAAQGIAVVPTSYQYQGASINLIELLEDQGWDQIVIKPAISASAYGTWRSCRETAADDQAKLTQQIATEDILIQPYMDEISRSGEWSLVFFAGQYSHAVLKKPAAGDFRVQAHLGGKVIAENPPEDLIKQAQSALNHAGDQLLYARIDGVESNGVFILMELEINEPCLFLGSSLHASAQFARAIERYIGN